MTRIKPLLIRMLFILILFIQHVGAQSLDAAKLALLKEDYVRVIELLKMQSKTSAIPEAHYLSALAYKGLGRFNAAIKQLRQMYAVRPKDTELLLLMGKVYEGLGNMPGARQMYSDVLKQDSLNRSARLNLAAVYFQENNFRKAEVLYHGLLKDEPGNAYFLRKTGICQFRAKQFQKAVNTLGKALRENEQDVISAFYLGNAYLKLKQLPTALQATLNGLRVHPKNRRLLKLKADILFVQNDFNQAATVYRNLVLHYDVSADVYKKLGLSSYYINRFPQAMLAFKKALRADSTDAVSFYYLALVHKKLGNYNESIPLFNKAVHLLIPDYLPDVYAQLADSYDNQNQYREAIYAYKQALQLAPERKIYLFFIASLYDRFYKDKQMALDQYQRFLEQAPQADKRYTEYALERMKALKEKLHFQKGRTK